MFSLKNFIGYFNKEIVIKGFFTAVFLSGFIYLEHFGVTNPYIYDAFALVGLYLFLTINRAELFVAGFFVGVLWFYWIPFSFRFYELTLLIPFAVIGLGLLYAIMFVAMGAFNTIFVRLVAFLFIKYLQPFDFDWFIPQLMFVNSHFGLENFHFDFLLVSIAIVIVFKPLLKPLAIIPFLLSFGVTPQPTNSKDLSIYLADPKLPQDKKWDRAYIYEIVDRNFAIIDKAITNKYDIVALPEVAFPLVLNKEPQVLDRLKKLSYKIKIVTGGLKKGENNNMYNSTFIFEDASLKIVDKYVLVPFGEYIPLPTFMKNLINDIIYNGAKDYIPADKPSNFMLGDDVFRNAICYEATNEKIYEDYPKYVIATSNNAWFTPSTQPDLQRLLLKFYAERYGTTIYHSANMGGSGVIRPF